MTTPITDVARNVLALGKGLSCDDQKFIADELAANLGYVLAQDVSFTSVVPYTEKQKEEFKRCHAIDLLALIIENQDFNMNIPTDAAKDIAIGAFVPETNRDFNLTKDHLRNGKCPCPNFLNDITALRKYFPYLCVSAGDIVADGLSQVVLVVDTGTTPVQEHKGVSNSLSLAWAAAVVRAQKQIGGSK